MGDAGDNSPSSAMWLVGIAWLAFSKGMSRCHDIDWNRKKFYREADRWADGCGRRQNIVPGTLCTGYIFLSLYLGITASAAQL